MPGNVIFNQSFPSGADADTAFLDISLYQQILVWINGTAYPAGSLLSLYQVNEDDSTTLVTSYTAAPASGTAYYTTWGKDGIWTVTGVLPRRVRITAGGGVGNVFTVKITGY